MKSGIKMDESLTRKLADLSRLELSDAEVTAFTSQLGQILGYVEQLQEVDVAGVDPLLTPIDLETALREDQVVLSPVDEDGKPRVLNSAPDVLYDGYKVPPIL